MKDFDIAKYLREHQMGSYGILNHYVDIKPLKEEEIAEDVTLEDTKKIPYEGTQPRRDGFGDEFEQADPVSEDMDDSMKYPLTVFIEAVKAAKAAGVPKDRMHYFIDVFAEGAEQVFGRSWDPSNPSKASIKAIGGDKKIDQISKAIKDLISSGVSIKQIKDFVDKQLVRDADSAVFERH